jgi:hypothetical protein
MQTSADARSGGFTCLPNWLFGQATAHELVLLLTLQYHAPNIHPSLATLARESGLSKRTVQNVLNDLEGKGWLVRKQAFNGKQKAANCYLLAIWSGPIGMAGAAMWPNVPLQNTDLVRQELPVGMAPAATKQEESNNKNKSNSLRPPLPPSGGNGAEDQGELITVEAVPVDAAVPNAQAGGIVSEPPPPTKPVKARPPRFQPSHDLIPAELLPVHPEILGFWATKAGARTQLAWDGLIKQLGLIQQDPQGGTEMVRTQLQTGIDRAPIKPWLSVSYGNWRKFGLPQGTSSNRRPTPEENAAAAVAFIQARDARKAAAAAAASQQTLLAEVVA